MKKMLLLLVMTLVVSSAVAQIEEVEIKEKVEIAQIKDIFEPLIMLYNYKNYDEYFMQYKDKSYSTITEQETLALGSKNTVIQFKAILIDMLDNNIEKKILKVSGNILHLRKNANNIEIRIITSEGKETIVTPLSKRQVEKLFPF